MVRDRLTCRVFVEDFNQLVRKLGGAPALHTGLDPFRADSIVERCREIGLDYKAVLVAWFNPETRRQTYTLDALEKAAPSLIEKLHREQLEAKAEVSA